MRKAGAAIIGRTLGRRAPGRVLTDGEQALAARVFGAGLDCSRVRVHDHGFLPLGLQPRHVAMAPNGRLYFHAHCCARDFSCTDPIDQRWFVHELTHVWQHQLGYPVLARGALRIGLSYRYTLAPGRTLADFNMEAQGELLADRFALVELDAPELVSQPRYRDRAARAAFDAVLAGFHADPLDRRWLPRARWRPAWRAAWRAVSRA